MKCPSCGADIGDSKQCEYCGSKITYQMKKEQEQINKTGCPKCGSTNVEFKRENQGEVRNKNSKQVIHRTVGFCKDCGYTWSPNKVSETAQKSNMVWWVLGWILFFPAPVMVLIWRKKNTWDIKVKIAVTVVFWLFVLIIGSGDDKEENKSAEAETVAVIDDMTDARALEISEEEIESELSVTEETEEPEPTSVPTPEPVSESNAVDSATLSQQQAYKKALSYLDFTAFSYKGLIEQLEYEGFSTEDATWAADNCGADWTKQAKLKAKEYMDFTSFSFDGLVTQLEYEGFSNDEAVAGASEVFGGDNSTEGGSSNSISQENALKKAKDYLSFSAFSRQGLIEQLEYEGFSKEDSTYAVDNCGADWNEQAVEKAKSYLDFSSFSRDGLIDQLLYEGFTKEQAEYGVKQVGY